MPLLAQSGFQRADWLVLGAYGALLVATGIYFSIRQRQRGTDDYFLASRSMPVWAVAFSILATAQSAATFVGAPEAAYTGDLTYLSTNIGGILAAIVLATVVIPAYYRKRVTTPYQLLESRFGPGAKEVTSLTYMIGRVFAGGARLFIGALPASIAVWGDIRPDHVLVAIAVFTVFGIFYTLWGGVSSVIWTDVIQVCVYLGAAVAAVIVLLNLIPASIPEIYTALANPPGDAPSKLTLLNIGIDPSKPRLGFDPSAGFTLLTAIFGFSLLTLASHGADQDLVQRMLTCKTPAKGSWSVISGVLIGIPAVTLFLILGLLLFIFYQRPDIMGTAAPVGDTPAGNEVVMMFALHELPGGLAGLVLAGLLAAGPCGINASLNSMSSTFVSDFYRPRRPNRDERHYLMVSRWAVAVAGLFVGAFAAACIVYYDPKNSTLLHLALGVMSFAYAGLLGVFFTALFTRRGNTRSVIAAIITGFLVVLILNKPVWDWWTGLFFTVDAKGGRIPLIPEQRLAFPWHLLIGSIVATGVCLLGKRPPNDEKSTGRITTAASTLRSPLRISLVLLVASGLLIAAAYVAGTQAMLAPRIHRAAMGNDLEAIAEELSRGVHVDQRMSIPFNSDMRGVTPLMCAAYINQPKSIRFLAQQGADIHAIDHTRRDAITLASIAGGSEAIIELLELSEYEDLTAVLITTARTGSPEAVKALLHHGADPVGRPGHPALAGAFNDGTTEKGRILLEHGADINAVQEPSRDTAIFYCIYVNNVAGVQLLLERGADINVVDRDGVSPLRLAERLGHQEIKELIQRHIETR